MDAADLILADHLDPAQAHTFLSQLRFQEPERADQSLQQLAEIVSDRRRLAPLLAPLLNLLSRGADPDRGLLRIQRYFEAVASPDALAGYLLDNQLALEVLVKLATDSPFLTQLLWRNPEYLYWLLSGDRLTRGENAQYFQAQAQKCVPFEREQTAMDALRRLHRREYLRIAAQDLLELVTLREIVQQISDLAEATLQAAFQVIFPRYAESLEGFAVMAMGKLGGRELNFSSDIDLIFVFSDEQTGRQMIRFARHFTRALREFSGEGHLYRVDLRLRPMGSTGEIAYPLSAYENYYATAAETFERLALIKCRWVAGDPTLGRRFVEMAQAFVYKKYLDQAAVEEIRWLKQRTDRKIAKRGESQSDVKLGRGGIREIEFFVQAFQILYGGQLPQLRQTSTLSTLDQLADLGLAPLEDIRSLKTAYQFLRTLEHRLQLVHDRQTQTLPESEEALERFARRLSIEPAPPQTAAQRFLSELERHRQAVRRIFLGLFESTSGGASGLEELMLAPDLAEDRALELLQNEGWNEPVSLWQSLSQLRDAPAFPHSPGKIRNLLANLLDPLLSHARCSSTPASLVNRLDRLSTAVGSRGEFLAGLVEQPELAERLLRVLASGETLSEILITHPELVDAVAFPVLPERPAAPGRTDSLTGEDRRLERARLRRMHEFKLAIAEIAGESTAAVRAGITSLAEIVVEELCHAMVDRDFADLKPIPWTLFGLGKLGARELTYGSDLDLMFLYDDDATHGTPAARLSTLVQQIKTELESYTSEGRTYQIDYRLRPEGNRSALATPLSAAQLYAQSRMEPWERLVMVKLRPIFINQGGVAADGLFRPGPFSNEEVGRLRHVRQRKEAEIGREIDGHLDLKVGRGGLMDIQFIVHRLQAETGIREPETMKALERLASAGVLAPADHRLLSESFTFYQPLESGLRLAGASASSRFHPASLALKWIAAWQETTVEDLIEQYQLRSNQVRQLFDRLF